MYGGVSGVGKILGHGCEQQQDSFKCETIQPNLVLAFQPVQKKSPRLTDKLDLVLKMADMGLI